MSAFFCSGTVPRAIGLLGFTYAVFTHTEGSACAGLRNLVGCTSDLTEARTWAEDGEYGYLVNLKTCRVQTYLNGQPKDFCLVGDTAHGRSEMGHTDLFKPFWLFSSVPGKAFDGMRDLRSTHSSLADAEADCLSSKETLEQLFLYDVLTGAIYTQCPASH